MIGRWIGATQRAYQVNGTRIGHLCLKGKPLRECIQLLFATEKQIKIASAGPVITLGGQSCVKGWQSGRGVECPGIAAVGVFDRRRVGPCLVKTQQRSEEHTSELQSLMSISYAVFCLKKKNKTQ